jgi:hypothetical protein
MGPENPSAALLHQMGVNTPNVPLPPRRADRQVSLPENMTNWLHMRNYVTLRVTGAENRKHLFECKDSKSESGHSLYVKTEATHSGIVNGNARFYRPDR